MLKESLSNKGFFTMRQLVVCQVNVTLKKKSVVIILKHIVMILLNISYIITSFFIRGALVSMEHYRISL